MPVRPPLPDKYQLPTSVNGWTYDSKSSLNAHTWTAPDQTASVGVFEVTGTVKAAVFDERVSGFARSREIFRDDTGSTPVTEGIEAAINWMETTDPPWRHPAVVETAFDPPEGFHLERYFLEAREATVWYEQTVSEDALTMAGRTVDTDPSLSTREYLRVSAWRGSGNATIALAPWMRADSSVCSIVTDPPDECGLSTAVSLAREWVAKQR